MKQGISSTKIKIDLSQFCCCFFSYSIIFITGRYRDCIRVNRVLCIYHPEYDVGASKLEFCNNELL